MRTTILILAALTLIAVLALACSEQDIAGQNEAAKGDSNTAGRDGDAIDIFDLRTGNCFAEIGATVPIGGEGALRSVVLFACDDPRADMEVTRMVFIERDGDFPGQAWFDEQIERECAAEDYSLSPMNESWEKGDRTILCLRKLRSADEPTYTADEAASTKEEVRIQAAVERHYDLMSAASYDALWNNYTRGFRERCSLNVMIRSLESQRIEGVHSLRVSGFEETNYVADRARVAYSVVGFDDAGRQTAAYDYSVDLVREDGRWLFVEGCYLPSGGHAPDQTAAVP